MLCDAVNVNGTTYVYLYFRQIIHSVRMTLHRSMPPVCQRLERLIAEKFPTQLKARQQDAQEEEE